MFLFELFINFLFFTSVICVDVCPLKEYLFCGENDPLKCVSKEWVCDGHPDCENGKDEMNCPMKTCQEKEFLCRSGTQCIPLLLQCDGIFNCVDKSDEKDCKVFVRKSCNALTEFDCNGDGVTCIGIEKVCDKKNDCGRNQDEQPGNSVSNCQRNDCRLTNNGGCSHYCTNFFTHIKCHCPTGYKLLADNKTCEDIDECSIPSNNCSQMCKNTPGGYSCSCSDGYEMDSRNPGNCLAKDGKRSILIVISGGRLVNIDLNTGLNRSKIINGTNESWPKIAVDLHRNPQSIFWSKLSKDKLGQMKIDLDFKKDNTQTIVIQNQLSVDRNESCTDLSFDWLRDLLFWTSSAGSKIYVTNTVLNVTGVLLSRDVYQPQGIAVDPFNAMIYWVDLDKKTSNPRIERMLMTTDNRHVVVDQGLRKPLDLTIDFVDQRLYWSDINPGSISYINLNGPSVPVIIISNKLLHPFSIAIFENKIYWSDSRQNQVISIDKRTGDNFTVLARIIKPFTIRVLHKLSQPKLNESEVKYHYCLSDKTNPCSHICLPNPPYFNLKNSSRFKCLCPSESALSLNKVDCIFTTKSQMKLTDEKRYKIIIGVLISLILIICLSVTLICVYICRQRSWAHSKKGINRKSFKHPIVTGDLMFIFKCNSHSSQLSELLVSDVSSTITT